MSASTTVPAPLPKTALGTIYAKLREENDLSIYADYKISELRANEAKSKIEINRLNSALRNYPTETIKAEERGQTFRLRIWVTASIASLLTGVSGLAISVNQIDLFSTTYPAPAIPFLEALGSAIFLALAVTSSGLMALEAKIARDYLRSEIQERGSATPPKTGSDGAANV